MAHNLYSIKHDDREWGRVWERSCCQEQLQCSQLHQAHGSVPALPWRHQSSALGSQLSFPLQTPAASAPGLHHLTTPSWGERRGKGSLPRLQSPGMCSEGTAGLQGSTRCTRSWAHRGTGLSAVLAFPSLPIHSVLSPGTLLISSKPIRCLNN